MISSRKKLILAIAALIFSLAIVVLLYLLRLLANQPPSPPQVWSGSILTWIDKDKDGTWDSDEVPLDVEFSIAFIYDGHRREVRRSRSSEEGKRGIGIYDLYDLTVKGYPETVEISVEPPMGYEITTPALVRTGIRSTGESFSFGFFYLPGVPTVTPLPLTPICTMKLEQYVRDITVAPDGTLWFGTTNGAFHFDPSENLWIEYTTEDGLASNGVRSIAVSSDNVVWFGTVAGITRFDGSLWTSFTTQDGLPYDAVENIAISSGNVVWFANSRGAGHFSPDTNSWTVEFVSNRWSTNVAASPDGSLWIWDMGHGTINQAIPITNSSQAQVSTTYRLDTHLYCERCSMGIEDMFFVDNKLWIVYRRPLVEGSYYSAGGNLSYIDLETEEWVDIQSVRLFGQDSFAALTQAPDGSFWLGAFHGLGHFVPAKDIQNKDTWTYYDHRLEKINRVTKLVFAPDGTLWVGTAFGLMQCVIPQE